MALKNCTVTCTDVEGVTHSVQLTAETLYEAVARGIATLRGEPWVAPIPSGLATVTVVVSSPRVEHRVKVKDFESWLSQAPKSPAERAIKAKLRGIVASK